MGTTKHASKASLKQMNAFLRGEIAAVETYERALAQHPGLEMELRENLESHRTRVNNLRQHIRECDGEPDESSGAWGAFANTLQAMANKVSSSEAISQLQDGEAHGTRDYEKHYDDLDQCCLEFTQQHLLPEQRRSHERIDGALRPHAGDDRSAADRRHHTPRPHGADDPLKDARVFPPAVTAAGGFAWL